jgi:hypothetical protein
MTLDQIAIKHNCDKSSLGHDYCRIYEPYFMDAINHRNTASFRLTEIGYLDGASAMTWDEWFCLYNVGLANLGHVTMIDIEPKRPVENIKFIHSDAKDPQLATNPFVIGSDIIIDDGSHINADIIATFKNLWPVLAPGGLYCVEDLHSSYNPYYEDSDPRPGAKGTAMGFFSRILHSVNCDFIEEKYKDEMFLYDDIEYVHVYKELVIIKKKS